MCGSRRSTGVLGVTLIELLVACAIIGVLMGLAANAIQAAREASRRATCQMRLKDVGLAIQNFSSQYQRLPPGTIGYARAVDWNDYRNTPEPPYWKYRQNTSFLVLILPYLERTNECGNLHPAMLDLNKDFTMYGNVNGRPAFEWFADVPGFDELACMRISAFFCPTDDMTELEEGVHFMGGSQPVTLGVIDSDGISFLEWLDVERPNHYGGTNYLGCSGAASGGIHPHPIRHQYRGMMSSGEVLRRSPDGNSNTIMAGESLGHIDDGYRQFVQSWVVGGLARGRGLVPWMAPSAFQVSGLLGDRQYCSAAGFGSAHPTTVNLVMGDGSVRAMSRNVDWELLYALAGAFDGEITSEDR